MAGQDAKPFEMCLYGHPCLREKATPVDPADPELARFCERMIATMRAENGIGLAAPQIGESKRVFVVEIPEQEDESDGIKTPGEQRFGDEPVALLNPELSEPSENRTDFVEGCLSIPELTGTVQRPELVTLEATLLSGERVRLRCGGLLARCLQHEYDHLEGVLFVDLLGKEERQELEPDLRRMQRKTVAQLRRQKRRKR